MPTKRVSLHKETETIAMNRYREIESEEALRTLIKQGNTLEHYAFQNITFGEDALQCKFKDSIFFGCKMPAGMRDTLPTDCYVLPALPVPFNMFPARLYTASELYAGYNYHTPDSFDTCYDTRIYKHYTERGKQACDIAETLARTLHDHSISDALHDLLAMHDERRIVAIMGGHSLLRTDNMYRKVVLASKRLAERGCIIVSGGGPGAMEASHLGARIAGYPDSAIDEALAMLAQAPSYKDSEWLPTAFALMEKMPRKQEVCSIGIPTWYYGHEPATPFATHIAKYFDNSIREDTLVTIAKGGIIYAPGSAGTMQEIFQDAAQNHYLTCGYESPMIFLGKEYWCNEIPVYPLLKELHGKGCYRNLLLTLTDHATEAVNAIMEFVER